MQDESGLLAAHRILGKQMTEAMKGFADEDVRVALAAVAAEVLWSFSDPASRPRELRAFDRRVRENMRRLADIAASIGLPDVYNPRTR